MMTNDQPTWIDPYTGDDYERLKVDVFENVNPWDIAAGSPRWKIVPRDLPQLAAYGNDYAECARNFRTVLACWRSRKDAPDA